MKHKFLFAITASLLLTGCRSSSDAVSSRPDLFAESAVQSTEPSSSPQTDSVPAAETEYPETLTDISGGIKNPPTSYSYHGEPITVTYQYSAAGTPTMGFMVLCSGQPVPYHTLDEPEDRLIHTAPINVPNQQEEIDLIFTPAGKKDDKVVLQICDIADPLFDLDSFVPDSQFLPMIRGKKGYFSYAYPVQIQMEADGIMPEPADCKTYTRKPIPASELRQMEYEDANGETRSRTENLIVRCTVPEYHDSVYYALHAGEKITMHLTLCGGSYPEVSVSLLMNWAPAAVFDGNTALKVPVSADQYTECSVVLDTSAMQPGRYLCALAVSPTESLSMHPKESFILDLTE